ncbi:hypothetical protein LOC68_21470 [Blastopirellula sp. JC732]|uniref:Carboxypeptidase regulatory-like domain-containing protein n=1 Tax=Blastopirellula sediminis TaxID=2894196 RepID=A0A9X1MPI0_9BACT|nr:hypothetical protein [Blastopirellula sediminis]MCC9605732.1 hypothetical protein [Blastopirellula sediminis]MCC9630968.1 hypothetical protein [Blastopirellula sediminis]
MIRSLILASFALVTLVGCGPTPVTGGTTGVLTTSGNPLGEMQVNVFRADGLDMPIGFGTTAADGSFELVQPAAAGPLVLTPGKYRFSVESIGSPVLLPKKYGSATTSPLEVEWRSDQPLALDIPGLKLPK